MKVFENQIEVYEHFLFLHCALRALSIPETNKRNAMVPHAQRWLNYWLDRSIELYGDTFAVYNCHMMTHLCDDVENFNVPLHEFSAFPFEDHLKSIKDYISPSTKNATVSVMRQLQLKESVQLENRGKHIGTIGTTRSQINDAHFFTKDNRLVTVEEKLPGDHLKCIVYRKNDKLD